MKSSTLALCFGVFLCGCPEDEDRAGDAGHAHHDEADASEEDVPCTDEYPTFEPGLSESAGELRIALISAQPEPPRQKVDNDWVLEITDAVGAPVSGAAITNAETYMEVHRHYGRTPPMVTELSEPGHYAFDDIDFKMRGPWELVFEVQPAGGSKQTVRFNICVE
jgi:hypothetical protein